MIDVTEIEKRVDRAIAAPIPVNAELGGLSLENMGQVMEFAKLMSVSGAAVPKYLRGNPGACLAICSRALRWQMDPFAVAEKSYMVINRGEERISFEAQLVHAVVTSRAPLQGRLRYEIMGEGDERRCRVWGTFKGEDKPHVYTSETLAKLRDARGRNDQGTLKGSPLWESQPEVQLAYSAVRQWCRLFSSDTLLGVYTPDELHEPVDVTPGAAILQRLKDAKASSGERGFDASHVNSVIEGGLQQEADSESTIRSDSRSADEVGRDNDDGGGNDPDAAGRDAAGGGDQTTGERPAVDEAAQAENQTGKPKGKGKRK